MSKKQGVEYLGKFIADKKEKQKELDILQKQVKELEVEIETIDNTIYSIDSALYEYFYETEESDEFRERYKTKSRESYNKIGKGKHKNSSLYAIKNEGDEPIRGACGYKIV